MLIDIIHVGVLLLHVVEHLLECGVLKEEQKLRIDGRVIDLSQVQHILNQHARLRGEIGVHLL